MSGQLGKEGKRGSGEKGKLGVWFPVSPDRAPREMTIDMRRSTRRQDAPMGLCGGRARDAVPDP